jgi:hypothetical protein
VPASRIRSTRSKRAAVCFAPPDLEPVKPPELSPALPWDQRCPFAAQRSCFDLLDQPLLDSRKLLSNRGLERAGQLAAATFLAPTEHASAGGGPEHLLRFVESPLLFGPASTQKL